MTENEAIKELETSIDLAKMCTQNYERKKEIQGYEMAINALEEVQQYRAIGTPEELQDMKNNYFEALSDWRQYRKIGTIEECREAVEKQTAKKVKSISPVKDGDSYVCLIGRCPCCGDILEENTVYCDCGQRYLLGDISWHNVTKTIEIFNRLNSQHIHLIKGNHDNRLLKNRELQSRFCEITDYKELDIGDGKGIVLCHYPIPCFKKSLLWLVYVIWSRSYKF